MPIITRKFVPMYFFLLPNFGLLCTVSVQSQSCCKYIFTLRYRIVGTSLAKNLLRWTIYNYDVGIRTIENPRIIIFTVLFEIFPWSSQQMICSTFCVQTIRFLLYIVSPLTASLRSFRFFVSRSFLANDKYGTFLFFQYFKKEHFSKQNDLTMTTNYFFSNYFKLKSTCSLDSRPKRTYFLLVFKNF